MLAGYRESVQAADTHPEARAVQVEALRRLGGARRLEEAFRMTERARDLAIAGLLARTPGMSRAAARAALLRRMLGTELYEAAYGRSSE